LILLLRMRLRQLWPLLAYLVLARGTRLLQLLLMHLLELLLPLLLQLLL
jgi:hypothetical protein